MALVFLGSNNVPTYTCLDSDIVGNRITGANLPGKIVYITNTHRYKFIYPDLTLGDYAQLNQTGGTTVSFFTDLSDVPANYTGQAGKALLVNSTENGLILGTVATSGESEPWALWTGSSIAIPTGSLAMTIPIDTEVSDPNNLADYHAVDDYYALWVDETADPSWYQWRGRFSFNTNSLGNATADGNITLYVESWGWETSNDQRFKMFWKTGDTIFRIIDVSGIAYLYGPELDWTNGIDIRIGKTGDDVCRVQCLEFELVKKSGGVDPR